MKPPSEEYKPPKPLPPLKAVPTGETIILNGKVVKLMRFERDYRAKLPRYNDLDSNKSSDNAA